jgi:hypothetical protein
MMYRLSLVASLFGAACALASLLLMASPTLGDEMKATAQGEVRSASKAENLPVMPPRESTMLSQERPDDFTAKFDLVDPYFGTVKVGGREIRIILGARSSDSVGPDVAWIDLDADGNLSKSESIELTPEKNDQRNTVNAKKEDLHFRLGGNDLPFNFTYMSYPGRGIYAIVAFDRYLEAEVTLGGETYRVAVIDYDSDGGFGGAKDLWTIVPADEEIQRPQNAWGLSALDEHRVAGDHRFQLAVQSDDKVVVTAKPGSEPRPEDLASHRERVEHIWFERFDGERDGFIEAQSVDTGRPKADDAIRWNFVSFAKAQEMAKQEAKPLFVDVLAFWCVWCYRMDYYTYPDAEVARLLNESFVPVKIIQEQDPAGDYSPVMEKLGARGIPAMGIWTPDGELVKYISGWKKPSEFVADLQAALAEMAAKNG